MLAAATPNVRDGAGSVDAAPATGLALDVSPQVSDLRVQVFDVGQGDCILIVSPTGKTVLIDGGSRKGVRAVVQALRQQKIAQIDYLIVTHAHADHIGGIEVILDNFPVTIFSESGLSTTSTTYERIQNKIVAMSINRVTASAGESYDLGGGAKLEVLSPQGDGRWIKSRSAGQPDLNANSIVIKLSYRNFAMLFMGDATAETEKDLLTRKVNLNVQTVKIGFHGSSSASTKQFLEATRARTAIISCGSDNLFGHPRQETLDRIRQRKMALFRTDLQGNIVLTTNGDVYDVKPQRVVNQAALFSGYTKAPQAEPGP